MAHDPDVTHVGICGCDAPNQGRSEVARLRAERVEWTEHHANRVTQLERERDAARARIAALEAAINDHEHDVRFAGGTIFPVDQKLWEALGDGEEGPESRDDGEEGDHDASH